MTLGFLVALLQLALIALIIYFLIELLPMPEWAKRLGQAIVIVLCILDLLGFGNGVPYRSLTAPLSQSLVK